MTHSTETERAALVAERAELMAKNEAATSWGAAVGARHERIVEIDRRLAALRRLASQDQEPVAWQWFYGDSWYTVTKRDVSNPEKYCRSQSDIVRPIYAAPQKPPPAAGWDQAIEAAYKICSFAIDQTHNMSRMAMAEELRDAIEALRHNAPPDTPAGKSAPLEPRGCPTPGACSCPSVTPDHGGADEGVRDLLSLVLDELLQHNKEYSHVTKPEVFDKIEKALSHQPAPVAANASAEARLRNHLGIVLSALRMHEEATGESFDDEGGDIAQIEREYNSTHPHASDCDKQESDCGATRCRDLGCFGVCGDETMKSEGGSRKQPFDPADAAGVKSGTVTFDGQTGRPNRDEVGASQTPGSSMSFVADKPIIAGQAPGPSDRTADVTVEDIALVLLDGWKAGKAPIQISRALLDVYGMWRR